MLPPLSTAEPPTVPTSARVSKCTFAGSSDEALPKKPRRMKTKTGTSLAVVKINRLGVCTPIFNLVIGSQAPPDFPSFSLLLNIVLDLVIRC